MVVVVAFDFTKTIMAASLVRERAPLNKTRRVGLIME
jgi:hypothetical protein